MAHGGIKLVKYSLFLFNLVFVIAGIGLIALGITTNSHIHQFEDVVNLSMYSLPSKIFIAVGIVMFIIAFFGCCGSVKENHSMVMTYSVLVGLVLVVQMGAAVAAYYKSDDLAEILQTELFKSMQKYGDNTAEGNGTTKFWDTVQHDLRCCGTYDFKDWFKTDILAAFRKVPDSCCITDFKDCARAILATTTPEAANKIIYIEGCAKMGVDSINIGRGATVGIVMSIIELLAVVAGCLLARNIRYSYETV